MSEPKTTTIRVPFDLSKWLEDQAAAQHRSVNGQILHIISQAKKAADNVKKA